MLPPVFNDYAFMHLTVTGLAMRLPKTIPVVDAVAGLGHGLLIAGLLGIVRFMSAGAKTRQPG
jgi:hypothetical protein